VQFLTNPTFITAVIGLLGMIVTHFGTVSKNKTKVAVVDVNDRVQLSKDQYQLITELRDMMDEQKIEMKALKDEVKKLQVVNLELTMENKELQRQLEDLNQKLESGVFKVTNKKSVKKLNEKEESN
jgi:hypothetical protein